MKRALYSTTSSKEPYISQRQKSPLFHSVKKPFIPQHHQKSPILHNVWRVPYILSKETYIPGECHMFYDKSPIFHNIIKRALYSTTSKEPYIAQRMESAICLIKRALYSTTSSKEPYTPQRQKSPILHNVWRMPYVLSKEPYIPQRL